MWPLPETLIQSATTAPPLARSALADAAIDALQRTIVTEMVPVDCPVEHRFTPGLYSRECRMPAGAVIVSKIHRTEHQFILSAGRLRIWVEDQGWVLHEAPYHGITPPGTRRVALILEDTIWTTFHTTLPEETTPEEVEARIIEPRDVFANLPPIPADWAALESERGA